MEKSDFAWMDTGVNVRAGKKLPGERKRAKAMIKLPNGSSRVWYSDGEYVFFRRKKANPHSLQRHEAFIAKGEYEYVETQDDVEIYKLSDASPFRRGVIDLYGQTDSSLRRHAVVAACARDWGLMVDVLTELSGRLKSRYHEAYAKEVYGQHLEYFFRLVAMRGGPTQVEIDQGVSSVRVRRGETRNRVIVTR